MKRIILISIIVIGALALTVTKLLSNADAAKKKIYIHDLEAAVLVETATDNNNRTVANIRSYFNKCNGTMGTQGSVEFMFDHTCNFRIPNNNVDIEELELEFIDFGAEEIFADEDGILIYAPFESFGAIQKELESRGIEILSSGFERIPQITKKLTEAEMADVEKLIEKIEEDDDVMNVYHTMEE